MLNSTSSLTYLVNTNVSWLEIKRNADSSFLHLLLNLYVNLLTLSSFKCMTGGGGTRGAQKVVQTALHNVCK